MVLFDSFPCFCYSSIYSMPFIFFISFFLFYFILFSNKIHVESFFCSILFGNYLKYPLAWWFDLAFSSVSDMSDPFSKIETSRPLLGHSSGFLFPSALSPHCEWFLRYESSHSWAVLPAACVGIPCLLFGISSLRITSVMRKLVLCHEEFGLSLWGSCLSIMREFGFYYEGVNL